jgi:sugar phosphate isomerase/epimerase
MWGSSITFQDYALEPALDLMAGLGFARVEMWKHHLHRCRTVELRSAFVQLAMDKGITMGGLNVVGEDYYRPFGTPEEFDQTLAGLNTDVDYALSLGTRDVLVWEGIRPREASDHDCMMKLLPRLIRLFELAIGYAVPKGVRFLVEPHPFTIGMSDEFLIALCDSLPPQHFGVTYDFCHYGVGRSSDYIGAVHRLGRRIRHIHFSDSDLRSSELHFAPGAGCMDLDELLSALVDTGFDGTMTLDLYGNPTPVAAARQSAPLFRQAAHRLGIDDVSGARRQA